MNLMTEHTRRRIRGVLFKLPGMITCDVFEGFVVAYLEDDLPAAQRRLFEVHLKVCRSCKRYLAAYRKTMSATAKLSEADQAELENVPEDLIAAILAARAPEDS